MNSKIVMLLAIPLAIGAAAVQSAEPAGTKAAAAKSAAAPSPAASQDRGAEAIVNSKCIECHGTGKMHAPRIGDGEDWRRRASKGLDALALGAIRGHGDMPARGGRADLTDAEFKGAIFYMFAKTMAAPAKQ